MSKILVTGATGHLGSGIINHLLEKGVNAADITALVRSEKGAEKLKEKGIETRIGSYEDASALTEAFKGIGTLMFVSSPDFDNTLRINQHANVVLAARNAGITRIVYTGIAFAETMNVAGLQYVHLATENMIKTTDIPYTFLRNGFYLENIFGNTLAAAVKSGVLVTAADNGKYNFALRDDLAIAAAVVLTESGHENKAYELVNSSLRTFEDYVTILSQLTGKSIKHESLSPEEAVSRLVKEGEIEPVASFNVYGLYLPIVQGQFSKESSALEQLIGRKPTSLEDALKQAIITQ
ncbi:MAG: hypothetical protein K0R05_3039 [Anaerocolumna sp.]|jgi:NAD(P)H dehydrogenase (quinone)|nr:hypothetical protein [Anaerocolumna sp.]